MTRTWGDLIRILRRMAAKGSLLRRLSRLYGVRAGPDEEEGSAIQVVCVAGCIGRSFLPLSPGMTISISRGKIRAETPHTLKLSPQEQEALALGLVNLNPPPIILSE